VSTSLNAHSRIMDVVRQANPQEDIRRQRVFAWAVTALLICGTPLVSQWLTIVAGPAKASSKLRRLVRWLDNALVDVAAYYRPFVQAAMAGWADQDLLLILDGTSPKGECLVCRVSVGFRGRAFPLCWLTFDTRSHSIRYERYVKVLDLALTLVPAGCRVTLLGDRGFGHRALMKWCRRAGWKYVLRLKADSIVIRPDGSRHRLDHWQPQPQSIVHLPDVRLLGQGRELIGPLHVHMALAPHPDSEIWYLASDSPHSFQVLAHYRCRFHIEHSFRDDKSGGWNWEASPLSSPIQTHRLCLVLAVATLYVVTEGTFLADHGRRQELDPHDARGLSYFQIGLRSFQRLLSQGRRLRLRLGLDPRPDPDPVRAYGVPFLLFGRFTWIPATIPAGC
jgi:Transposase DDE domain